MLPQRPLRFRLCLAMPLSLLASACLVSSLPDSGLGQPTPSVSPEASTLKDSPLSPPSPTPSPAAFPSLGSDHLNEQLPRYLRYVAEGGVPDILIVGSSRARQGVNPLVLARELNLRQLSPRTDGSSSGPRSLRVYNFGINGATAQVVNVLLQEVLSPDQLPKRLLWADGVRALNSGRRDRTYEQILSSPGFQVLKQGLRPCLGAGGELVAQPVCTPLPQALLGATQSGAGPLERNAEAGHPLGTATAGQSKPSTTVKTGLQWCPELRSLCPPQDLSGAEYLVALRQLGFNPILTRFSPELYFQTFPRVPGRYDGDYRDFSLAGVQQEALQRLLGFTQARQLPVVFVNLPLTQSYLDESRQAAELQFRRQMGDRAQALGFSFHDLGPQWPQRYDFFMDPSHLNHQGAIAVSRQLGYTLSRTLK